MDQNHPRKYVLNISFFLALSHTAVVESDWRAKPIYGADDRAEVYEAPEQLRIAAKSVALIVSSHSLQSVGDDRMQLVPLPTDASLELCFGERFIEQPTVSACTAFLVSQNLVATAAHCVKPAGDANARGVACKDLRIVFDYALDGPDTVAPVIDTDDVYQCSAIEDGVYYPPDGPDWRIVRLDRPVLSSDRPALQISTASQITPNTPVAVLGHPRGLPMKVASNAIILRNGSMGGAVADLDTFVGNSGSPVLTEYGCGPVVIGLLSRGTEDFDIEPDMGQCRSTRLCDKGACLGEQITSSSPIADYADRPFTGC